MATATHDTYESVGIREDLADIIHDTSPTETPFTMGAKKGKAKQTTHGWQRHQLAAAAANAQVEGADPTGNDAKANERLANICQISWKVVRISDTLEATDRAGRDREMAKQIINRGLELKNDIEFNITGLRQVADAGSDTTARKSASLEAWIQTNPTVANGGYGASGVSNSISGNLVVTGSGADGTLRSATETMLKQNIQACWDNGGKPRHIICGGRQKVNISAFTGGATKFDKTEDMKLYAAWDYYVSDFGTLHVIPSRFIRKTSGVDRTVFILDMDHWGIDYLRPYSKKDLATTGDYEQKMIRAEWTLMAGEERSSSKVADLQ